MNSKNSAGSPPHVKISEFNGMSKNPESSSESIKANQTTKKNLEIPGYERQNLTPVITKTDVPTPDLNLGGNHSSSNDTTSPMSLSRESAQDSSNLLKVPTNVSIATSRGTGRGAISMKPVPSRLWDLLQPLARLCGIVTAIVMSGAGAELAVMGFKFAPGMLVGAAAVLILETMWVAALFIDLVGRRGEYTLPLRCWDFCRWSCGRARAPLYACAATALLLADLTTLCTASGGLLLVLALLRAAVPFSPHATHGPHSPRAGSSLLSQVDTPDVFFTNSRQNLDSEKSEEMTVLHQSPNRSRASTPVPQVLLEL